MNPELVPDDSDLLGFPEGVGPFVAGCLQSGIGSGVLNAANRRTRFCSNDRVGESGSCNRWP